MKTALSRRTFLRGASVSLALPMLNVMRPAVAAAASVAGPAADGHRRMVFIWTTLGIHGPNFFPETAGRDYKLSPYLEPLKEYRDEFTVLSGVSHPDVDGGHNSEYAYLTAAPHPGSSSFRNTVS